MNIFINEFDKEKYFTAKYYLESSTNLQEASYALAVGQSFGNIKVRNSWETDEMVENHCAKILNNIDFSQKSGVVDILFPVANIDFSTDGISQLLCVLMGGQLDIDIIKKCHLIDIKISETSLNKYFRKPCFGITGIRKYTGVYNKPILGGIIKPKVGLNCSQLSDMVEQMADNGINFIKEDECMSNPAVCPFNERIDKIGNLIKNKYPKLIYSACINSDFNRINERIYNARNAGINSFHLNFWCGLGVYKSIRDFGYGDMFVFFQKSGDKILTNKLHNFHISWNVICKIAAMSGVDFIHNGMYGGYLNETEEELNQSLSILRNNNVMPSLSCGFHPGLVELINSKFGVDYMANVGGAIHGHPGGTVAGVKAMRQAIDGNYSSEYYQAIDKWGKL